MKKNNLRKIVVGQINTYSGAQMGPEDKCVRSFSLEKLSPGIYKVTPKVDLAKGEYGFFYSGSATLGPFAAASMGGGKIFDFGVGNVANSKNASSNSKSTSTNK